MAHTFPVHTPPLRVLHLCWQPALLHLIIATSLSHCYMTTPYHLDTQHLYGTVYLYTVPFIPAMGHVCLPVSLYLLLFFLLPLPCICPTAGLHLGLHSITIHYLPAMLTPPAWPSLVLFTSHRLYILFTTSSLILHLQPCHDCLCPSLGPLALVYTFIGLWYSACPI